VHIIPALAAVFSELNGLTCFLAPLLPTPLIALHEAELAAAADAAAADLEGKIYKAEAAADAAGNNHLTKATAARYRMQVAAEWHEFIREPLRQTREEMRRSGILLPDLPADIELGEDDG
jgi:hypothetical protein